VAVDGPPAPSDPHSNTLLRTMPSKTISQRSLSALNLEWDCGLDLSYFLLPRCGKFSGACRDPLFGDRSCTRFRLTRNRSGARMPDSSVCIAYFHFGEHHLCSSLLCAFRAIADQPNGLSQGASRGPLSVPAANTVGGNGVYSYGRTFPQSTSRRDNYFVDVLFTPIDPTQLPISKLQSTQSQDRGRCRTGLCSYDGNRGLERWNRLRGLPVVRTSLLE
jgi:hypothetical protein